MESNMQKFEKHFKAEMLNYPSLSQEDKDVHYWLAFFMTFINNWERSWKYVFWTGNDYDVSFLLKFVEDTKDYNVLFDPSNPRATVDAHLYWFYRDNAALTQTPEFKKFIEVVSEPSFEAKIRSVFPEQPQKQC
jgi:hypothetical protein